MSDNSQSKQTTYCKNHAQIVSRYFVSQQPWIRYCHECALNVALCGRNISQDYSSTQFQRKMQIVSIVNELRRNTKDVQDNNLYFSKIINLLEECSKPLNQRITQIDNAIKELTISRDKLQRIYDQQILGNIKNMLQRQSRITILSRQIKNQLQTIQSRFSSLIEIDDQEQFMGNIEIWNKSVENCKKQLMNQEQFIESKEKVFDVMECFYNNVQKLTNFSLNLSTDTKPFSIDYDYTLDMVLTPVDANSLNATITGDNVFKKTKRELKLRTHKKNQTDRDLQTRTQSKRASLPGIQNREAYISCGIFK